MEESRFDSSRLENHLYVKNNLTDILQIVRDVSAVRVRREKVGNDNGISDRI